MGILYSALSSESGSALSLLCDLDPSDLSIMAMRIVLVLYGHFVNLEMTHTKAFVQTLVAEAILCLSHSQSSCRLCEVLRGINHRFQKPLLLQDQRILARQAYHTFSLFSPLENVVVL